MEPNPLIGVIYHWIGGLASASNFIPFRPIKRLSWEVYWIIQGFAAWIVAPLLVEWLPAPLGIALSEWKDSSTRTRLLVSFGLFLLIASTVMVGSCNYLEAR